MASRAELIEMLKELGGECEGSSIEELYECVKKAADRRIGIPLRKKQKVSADNLSLSLKKFLTEEYDYVLKDKDGNVLNYKGEIIKKARRKKKSG